MGIFDSLFGATNQLKISLYESDEEVPDNVPYRLINDPDNLVKIHQDYTIDSDKQWDILEEYWGLHIAGVSYREEEVLSFMAGENRKILLLREPTSKHPHAIAVYGTWTAKNYLNKGQLGFVPDEDAREIHKKLKKLSEFMLCAKLNRMFIPTKEKNAGLMIDVILLEPKWPRFEIHGFGKKSGRRRKKTYRAKTFDNALEQAYADDMIVDIQACKEIP